MKKALIFLLTYTIIACANNNQESKDNNITDSESLKNKVLNKNSSMLITENSIINKDNINPAITCEGENLNNWHAFDDYIEQPKCKELEKFQIKNYSCLIEDNAFGLGFQSSNLTNYNDHRVLAFRTQTQCKEALEIREANRETA